MSLNFKAFQTLCVINFIWMGLVTLRVGERRYRSIAVGPTWPKMANAHISVHWRRIMCVILGLIHICSQVHWSHSRAYNIQMKRTDRTPGREP